MTVEDIFLAASAKQEENKEMAKMLAWLIYNGAALTGIAVNDPKKFPKLEDAFPTLFEKEKGEQQNWVFMKERVEEFAKIRRASMG